MIRRLWSALLLAALLVPGLSCTDASLMTLPPPPPPVPDNKLQIDGGVCTQAPADLVFPLRVLFLVDASESMEVTDPPDPVTGETGRERAVRETAEALLDGSGDVEISVVRFSSEAQPITAELDTDGTFLSYFTSDLDYVLTKLPLLSVTDRTTNYIQALAEGYAEIRDELMSSDQQSLSLSTYHVILISDGIPDVEGGENTTNSNENILEAVDAIMDLGRLFHIERMTVNTALISSGNPTVDAQAEDLLEAMADTGHGTFRSFESGGELNFLYVDLTSLKRVFTLRTLLVQNLNALVLGDNVVPDSDGDGLWDEFERKIEANPFLPDSDGDGRRDGVEFFYMQSGMDPLDPLDAQCFVPDYCFDDDPADGACDNGCTDADADGLCDCIDADADGICDPANYVDTDGDGLVDCEERYTGTNRNGADTDGDGLVDFLELRFGTSPDTDDVTDDVDWDAVPNGEEVRTGTDPHYASTLGRSELAYRYQLTESAELVNGQTCYDFRVTNITLTEMETPLFPDFHSVGFGGQGYSGHNRVLVMVGEVPFDDLESYARFRVACVEATFVVDGNYRDPPSGRAEVHDADFVDLAEFDPDVHCIPPGGRVEP